MSGRPAISLQTKISLRWSACIVCWKKTTSPSTSNLNPSGSSVAAPAAARILVKDNDGKRWYMFRCIYAGPSKLFRGPFFQGIEQVVS